jgi:oligosaccharide repeat unit polymerase
MEMSFEALAAIQLGWIAVGLYWFMRRADEIPLLTAVLTGYISGYRYWSVTSGRDQWADISNLGYEPVNSVQALSALNLMVLGECVFLVAYLLTQKRAFPPAQFQFSPEFSRWLRSRLFLACLCLIPLVKFVEHSLGQQLAEGKSMAFQISAYLYLFPWVASSLAILLVALWRYADWRDGGRWIAVVLVVVLFYMTYGSTGRFKFLSWIVASGVILSAPYRPLIKLAVMGGGVAAAVVVFAIAGAQRQEIQFDQKAVVWERLVTAEDANMLEGFVFVQAGVAKLGYRYGGEHLEILYRPIPRTLWPGKPVTSYMLRLTGQDEARGGTLGISPSLFGSFYMEGGVTGIILLSVIYGWLIGTLVRWGAGLHPFAAILLKGLLCACMIPLLRGGDLPGIYAWFGMAFWPFLLLFWFKRKQLVKDSDWFVDLTLQGEHYAERRGGASRTPALSRRHAHTPSATRSMHHRDRIR